MHILQQFREVVWSKRSYLLITLDTNIHIIQPALEATIILVRTVVIITINGNYLPLMRDQSPQKRAVTIDTSRNAFICIEIVGDVNI